MPAAGECRQLMSSGIRKDNGCACATRSCSCLGHVGPLSGSSQPPCAMSVTYRCPVPVWPCPAAARINCFRRPNVAPISPQNRTRAAAVRKPACHAGPHLDDETCAKRGLAAAREVRAREKDYAHTIRRRKHSVAPCPRFCCRCDPCVTARRRQAFESAPRIVARNSAAPTRECVIAMTPKMTAASSLFDKIEVRCAAIRLTLWSVGVFVARQKHVAVAENSFASCDAGGTPDRCAVVLPSQDEKPVARGRFGSRARNRRQISRDSCRPASRDRATEPARISTTTDRVWRPRGRGARPCGSRHCGGSRPSAPRA